MEEILRLKDEIEDIELEKQMIFEQTGLHTSSKKVIERIKECDEEIKGLKEKIMELEKGRR